VSDRYYHGRVADAGLFHHDVRGGEGGHMGGEGKEGMSRVSRAGEMRISMPSGGGGGGAAVSFSITHKGGRVWAVLQALKLHRRELGGNGFQKRKSRGMGEKKHSWGWERKKDRRAK